MPTSRAAALGCIALAACAGCAPGSGAGSSTDVLPAGAEARSLLGNALVSPELPPETRQRYEEQLREARARYDNDSTNADAIIWLGRRTAYLGRYREAVDVFTRGIALHPRDARFLRHRGHRYITLRRIREAAQDLRAAAALVADTPDQVEPDGLPNARNIPTSTLQSNIWYHLGLAHYLEGDFATALHAYREGMLVSANRDMRVAMTHWLYMTLRRLGRRTEAAALLESITDTMDIIENDGYHRLLLMYKGRLSADSLLAAARSRGAVDAATVGYGVGNWYFYGSRRALADSIFRQIVHGGQWSAFGHIAAEAELARLRGRGDRALSEPPRRGSQ
ncbi:MAG: tetratricopeptide repeat protein [Gemmatimonadaceae bacterium]